MELITQRRKDRQETEKYKKKDGIKELVKNNKLFLVEPL